MDRGCFNNLVLDRLDDADRIFVHTLPQELRSDSPAPVFRVYSGLEPVRGWTLPLAPVALSILQTLLAASLLRSNRSVLLLSVL